MGRTHDTNCDGTIDELDPPNVIFVSGNARGTCCSCGGYSPSTCRTGVLRVLDGASGQELWSLDKATSNSVGFAGTSVALGDIDGDGRLDIVAATGEGYLVVLDGDGHVLRMSSEPIPNATAGSFGMGGGLAVADMDGDGHPEIAYGATVFSTKDSGISKVFTGRGGNGGGNVLALSTFADLDGAPDKDLELLAGNTLYGTSGAERWSNELLPNGFSAVADFNKDGQPEAVLVGQGQVWLLRATTGQVILGPLTLAGQGGGGPPTVADLDGDGSLEIGIAQKNFYSAVRPNFAAQRIDLVWQTPNHDFSSSVTGSTVFDFEGDGAAEVVYSDECFLWVFDGRTGHVRFAAPTTSFTSTEAPIVADVDGDGHAEILMVSNGANPDDSGWRCDTAPWNEPSTDPNYPRPAWSAPPGALVYRGLSLYGDRYRGWVGTRALWNQHTYHVSNICDGIDSACDPPNLYGQIPIREKPNWSIPWLNNFRQNQQDKGLFDAPDATVTLSVKCSQPLQIEASVRNLGQALLPAHLSIGLYVRKSGADRKLTTLETQGPLYSGQSARLTYTVPDSEPLTTADGFIARVESSPSGTGLVECRTDNNESAIAYADCGPAR